MPGITFKVGEKVELIYTVEGARAPRLAVVKFRSRQQARLQFDAGATTLRIHLRQLTEIHRLPSADTRALFADRAVPA